MKYPEFHQLDTPCLLLRRLSMDDLPQYYARIGSFAYMLAEDSWNQGFATEALCVVLDFAFSEMEISTVICDHFAKNPASGRVMQKVGMDYRRTVPCKYEKQGIFHDAVEYVLTKEDWIKKHGTSKLKCRAFQCLSYFFSLMAKIAIRELTSSR